MRSTGPHDRRSRPAPADHALIFGQRSQQRRLRRCDRSPFDRAHRPGDAGDAMEVCRVDAGGGRWSRHALPVRSRRGQCGPGRRPPPARSRRSAATARASPTRGGGTASPSLSTRPIPDGVAVKLESAFITPGWAPVTPIETAGGVFHVHEDEPDAAGRGGATWNALRRDLGPAAARPQKRTGVCSRQLRWPSRDGIRTPRFVPRCSRFL
jgi:hypothetical protein